MKIIYNNKRFLLLLLISLLSSGIFLGCSETPSATQNFNEDITQDGETSVSIEGSVSWMRHSDRAQPDDFHLSSSMQEMITDYIGVYQFSLAKLKEEDITHFFAQNSPESIKSALKNQAALHYLIELRDMQPHDMTIPEFRIVLEPVSLTFYEEEDDKEPDPDLLKLTVYEHRYQNFAFTKNIASNSTATEHHFIFDVSAKDPVIYLHQKFEDADFLIREHLESLSKADETTELEENTEEIEEFDQALFLSEINRSTEELLALAKLHLKNKDDAQTEADPDATGDSEDSPLTATNEYDRQAAVAYAMEWVHPFQVNRNPEWFVYDELGGNCNNFVSQSLFAGGIPMDTKGYIDSQWKWYDNSINSRQTERGRSPSWTGVNEFYKYVNSNSGSGMVATTEANYYDGELGDVIIFGYDDRWKHAVLITGIIKDDEGRVVDYLINSNTADQMLYPVSAYGYSDTALIKIIGYNE